jgi:hypothetical protein
MFNILFVANSRESAIAEVNRLASSNTQIYKEAVDQIVLAINNAALPVEDTLGTNSFIFVKASQASSVPYGSLVLEVMVVPIVTNPAIANPPLPLPLAPLNVGGPATYIDEVGASHTARLTAIGSYASGVPYPGVPYPGVPNSGVPNSGSAYPLVNLSFTDAANVVQNRTSVVHRDSSPSPMNNYWF